MKKMIAALSLGVTLGLTGALWPQPIFSPCLAICYDTQCRDAEEPEACVAECTVSCEIYEGP